MPKEDTPAYAQLLEIIYVENKLVVYRRTIMFDLFNIAKSIYTETFLNTVLPMTKHYTLDVCLVNLKL